MISEGGYDGQRWDKRGGCGDCYGQQGCLRWAARVIALGGSVTNVVAAVITLLVLSPPIDLFFEKDLINLPPTGKGVVRTKE